MKTPTIHETSDAIVFRPIIKPFVPRFDMAEGARGGWTEAVDDDMARQRGQRGFPP